MSGEQGPTTEKGRKKKEMFMKKLSKQKQEKKQKQQKQEKQIKKEIDRLTAAIERLEKKAEGNNKYNSPIKSLKKAIVSLEKKYAKSQPEGK